MAELQIRWRDRSAQGRYAEPEEMNQLRYLHEFFKSVWRDYRFALASVILLLVVIVLISPGFGRQDRFPRNVILISIDTLRPDRLGCYGYELMTSPAIDKFANEAIRFDQAISQSPWTTPSHASLFTSLYPSSHGVNQGWSEFERFLTLEKGYPVLPDSVLTLPEILQKNGYRTFAMTGGTTLAGELGFSRGFEVYLEQSSKLNAKVLSTISEWLAATPEKTPFFLFLHTFEVHAPYTRSFFVEPLLGEEDMDLLQGLLRLSGSSHSVSRIAQQNAISEQERYLQSQGWFRKEITSALYDSGIRYADGFLGKFFQELRNLGLYDRSLIILMSDHGEEFGDHHAKLFYNNHCHSTYDEVVRVPLIIRIPGGRKSVVREQVQLIDIAPTILDALKIPIPKYMQGRSLAKTIKGERSTKSAFTESTCVGSELKSIRSDDYKYIATVRATGGRTGIQGSVIRERLYDLHHDPLETRDLATDHLALLTTYRRRLKKHFQMLPKLFDENKKVEVSDERREQLRALGYID